MLSLSKYIIAVSFLCLVLGFAYHIEELPKSSESEDQSLNLALDKNRSSNTSYYYYDSIFYYNPRYITRGFDYPVGKPNADNYYLASKFGNNNHLGEDWNGRGGGNSDLGDPVYAIGNGVVTVAKDICCGWGNVVRVVHKLEGHPEFKYLESVYAHLDRIDVFEGQLLEKGQTLGSIGTAHGTYVAHLHLELRDFLDMKMGPGYSKDWEGYLDPSEFIRNNRQF